jgi:hypothetical protein
MTSATAISSSAEAASASAARPAARPQARGHWGFLPKQLAAALDALRRFFGLPVPNPTAPDKSSSLFARAQHSVERFTSKVVGLARPAAPRPQRETRRLSSAAVEQLRKWRVRVHVYRLVGQRTNRLCQTVGVGGVYHTGVEIGGVEYGFGCHDHDFTGVWRQIPRQLPSEFARGRAVHISVVDMGKATLTARELSMILQALMGEYPGNGYSVLHRNCNHFTFDLCQRLVQKAPPAWINAAAAKGARVHRAVSLATSSVAKLTRAIRAPLPQLSLRFSRRKLLKIPTPQLGASSSDRDRWLLSGRRAADPERAKAKLASSARLAAAQDRSSATTVAALNRHGQSRA